MLNNQPEQTPQEQTSQEQTSQEQLTFIVSQGYGRMLHPFS